MKRLKRLFYISLSVIAILCAVCQPALAVTEAEVEAQVAAIGKDGVTGNVLVWFLCALAFLKVSQKIDSFMSALGINVGHTGGSLMAEALIAARGAGAVRGFAGGGRGGGGDHIGSAGADGGGTGNDPAPVALAGKAGGGVGHSLLISALIDPQSARILIQRLTETHHDTVAEDGEHTVYKLIFYAVKLNVLVIQKLHNGLTDCHSRRSHKYPPCQAFLSQQTVSPYFSLLALMKAWISSAMGISSEQEWAATIMEA